MHARQIRERERCEFIFEFANALGKRRLGNTARAQRGRANRRGGDGHSEARQHLMLHPHPHFERHAREHDHGTARRVEPESGCRSPLVRQRNAAGRHHRLRTIRLDWCAAEPVVPGKHCLPHHVVELERHAEQFRDHVLRHVIARGAKAAGGDHKTGAGQCFVNRRANFVGRIDHGGAPHNAHTGGTQRLAEKRRVGVDREAEEEFGADGDEFDAIGGHGAENSGTGKLCCHPARRAGEPKL